MDPAILGFERAIREFKDKLKDDKLYAEILATRSIDHVYHIAAKIQDEQGKTGHLRHLSKIKRYLEKMRLYADAIDTFVQVKPDILALIWGPMKLLIQWTSTLSKSQDAIANITSEIGDLLPQFTEMATLFSHNTRLNDIMCLFFQDILDFYLVTLKFFSLSSTHTALLSICSQRLIREHSQDGGTFLSLYGQSKRRRSTLSRCTSNGTRC